MSTDRELLELAAKAIGYNTGHHWNAERLRLVPAVDSLVVILPDGQYHTAWNPLTDDSDALRLAIQLRVSIDHNHPADQSPWVSATADGGRAEKVEEFEDERDRFAATRMAIVRAAAEIGRRMP